MRKCVVLINGVAGLLVASFVVALRTGEMPLGVKGEWEWLRIVLQPSGVEVGIAGGCVAVYAVFVGIMKKWLSVAGPRWREVVAVLALMIAAVGVQIGVHSGAPTGYGLAKWVMAIHQPGASGYFTVAKKEVRDGRAFLSAYPDWIQKQDSLHVGTHPPGLIMCVYTILRTMEDAPGLARFVVDHAPYTVAMAFRYYGQQNPMTTADRATLTLTGFLTMLACAGSVAPLYVLARANLSASGSWSTATLWPLAPSAILFQPASDTAIAMLSTSAFALAIFAGINRGRRSAELALATGVVLAIGMQVTLAFLAVGMVVALVVISGRGGTGWEKGVTLAGIGAGFLGLTMAVWGATGANPFVIWWWNQRNHARFYEEFTRSYWAWVIENPIELAVGIGLPAVVWGCVGAVWPKEFPRVSLATAGVLVLLTLGGRNLSEVGRLWIPFMPSLLVGAGFAMERAGCGSKSLGTMVGLIGIQTLAMEATIQVVYPI